jgi:hypothetical protein
MCFDHISGVPMKTKIEGQVLCCIKVVSNIVTLGLRSKGNIYVSICTSNKSRHNEQRKERGNWIEQKITYFLSVGFSLFSIVPVKEKITYMKNDISEK